MNDVLNNDVLDYNIVTNGYAVVGCKTLFTFYLSTIYTRLVVTVIISAIRDVLNGKVLYLILCFETDEATIFTEKLILILHVRNSTHVRLL